MTRAEMNLFQVFSVSRRDSTSPQKRQESLKRLKKVLIYLIMVLDTFRLFLMLKSKGAARWETRIDLRISASNFLILRNKLRHKKQFMKHKFQLDPKLMNLQIRDLVGRIRIEELMLFLRATQLTFISEKSRHKPIGNGMSRKVIHLDLSDRTEPGGLVRSFDPCRDQVGRVRIQDSFGGPMSLNTRAQSNADFGEGENNGLDEDGFSRVAVREFELTEVLLAKVKRTDEVSKFIFKRICANVREEFRSTCMSADKAEIERQFNSEVLGSNPQFEKAFRNKNNVTKKNIIELKSCGAFLERMQRLIRGKILLDTIQSDVLAKNEKWLNSDLSLAEFFDILMKKTNKNGWIIQNILNSVELADVISIDSVQKGLNRFRSLSDSAEQVSE